MRAQCGIVSHESSRGVVDRVGSHAMHMGNALKLQQRSCTEFNDPIASSYIIMCSLVALCVSWLPPSISSPFHPANSMDALWMNSIAYSVLGCDPLHSLPGIHYFAGSTSEFSSFASLSDDHCHWLPKPNDNFYFILSHTPSVRLLSSLLAFRRQYFDPWL